MKLLNNVSLYLKYFFKFYLKNRGKVVLFPLSEEINAKLYFDLIPKVETYNHYLDIKETFKLTDFKNFKDFFEFSKIF